MIRRWETTVPADAVMRERQKRFPLSVLPSFLGYGRRTVSGFYVSGFYVSFESLSSRPEDHRYSQ